MNNPWIALLVGTIVALAGAWFTRLLAHDSFRTRAKRLDEIDELKKQLGILESVKRVMHAEPDAFHFFRSTIVGSLWNLEVFLFFGFVTALLLSLFIAFFSNQQSYLSLLASAAIAGTLIGGTSVGWWQTRRYRRDFEEKTFSVHEKIKKAEADISKRERIIGEGLDK